MLIRAGYHVPTVSNSSWVSKRKRLKQLAFQTNAAGIQNHLDTMTSWVNVFNSVDSNGVATLHTMQEPHSSVPVFRALTVVFAPSVALFLHCSWRVLSIDAAFEYKGRSDKNYIILEGITSTSTIFPLAFGFCFGESERTYNQFWDDVLGYSDTLKSAIDNVNTRINADRHHRSHQYHLRYMYSRAKSGAADSDCGVKLGAENSLSGFNHCVSSSKTTVRS